MKKCPLCRKNVWIRMFPFAFPISMEGWAIEEAYKRKLYIHSKCLLECLAINFLAQEGKSYERLKKITDLLNAMSTRLRSEKSEKSEKPVLVSEVCTFSDPSRQVH